MSCRTVWRCKHCTYDNDSPTLACAACSRPNDTARSTDRPAGSAEAVKKHHNKLRERKGLLKDSKSGDELNNSRPGSDTSITSRTSTSSSVSSLSASKGWTCGKCLLENGLGDKVCSSCSSARPTSNFPYNIYNREKGNKEEYKKNCHLSPSYLSQSSSSKAWNCSQCGYTNSVVRAHCILCNHQYYSLTGPSPLSKSGPNLSTPPKIPSIIPRNSDPCLPTIPLLSPRKPNNQSPKCSPHKQNNSFSSKSEKDFTPNKYDDIVKYFRKLKTNFVDDSFRPCDQSIFGDSVSSDRSIVWKRPHEVDSSNEIKWTIFRTPLPTDIVQGSLGDCWLLSSLSVLAHKTSIIEKVFMSKEVCNEGVYQLRLCKDGVWTSVIVDDYFPTQHNKFLYAQSERKQLWVNLIEKAVAKLYGSYHSLKAGHCGEGLQLLTGAPIESVKMSEYSDDIELLWGMLLSYRDADFPMGVCCMGEEEEAMSLGLTTRHAYALLNLYTQDNLRLIQLRNPWAKDTWSGPYHNKCPKWTEALRSELMVYPDSSEAVFWMELSDFVRYFTVLDVCRLHNDWNEWRLSGVLPPRSDDTAKVTLISVEETCCVDISLIQPSSRGNQDQIVDLSMAVLSTTEALQPAKLLEFSPRGLINNVTCSTILNPGTYMILPMAFSHWGPDSDREPSYVLACFVEKSAMLWQDKTTANTLPDVLYKVAVAKGEYKEAVAGCSVYSVNKKVAGLIMAVENRHPSLYFHISCSSHTTSNVVCSRNQITTSDWVPPLHRMILMVITQLDEGFGFKIQSSYKYSLAEKCDTEPEHEPCLTDNLHYPVPL